MILSTQTDVLARCFGYVESVKILAEAGYDAIDFSMFGMERPDHFLNTPEALETIREIRRTADECGIVFNQAHAPFPSRIIGRDDYNETIQPALIRSIEYAGILGAGIIIIHPISIPGDPAGQKEINMALYHSLEDTLRRCGVKAALENMFTWNNEEKRIDYGACAQWEQFCEYLDELDPQLFTACLDIGHSGLVGIPAADMIRGLGHDRLGSLHVHDNDNKTDLHTLPFVGKLEWNNICKALHDIGYEGELTFEADGFLRNYTNDNIDMACRYMVQTGRYLISLIEGK